MHIWADSWYTVAVAGWRQTGNFTVVITRHSTSVTWIHCN